MLKNFTHWIRTHFKLSRLWLRHFALWLSRDLKFLWYAALPVAIAYGIILFWLQSETSAKAGGLLLEFMGVATVAWGLRETRELFEKPSVFGHLKGWFSRFPKYRRNVHLSPGTLTATTSLGKPTLHIWRNTQSGAPIDERVAALEVNLLRVKEELRDTQKDVDKRFSDQEKSLKEEAEGRSESDRRIEEKLEASETGGLHISAMGLFWLMAGMPLTVFPREIAGFGW